MKKIVFITFLFYSYVAFGQIKHLNNFWCFPNNVQGLITSQEKLNGKVRKVIYENNDGDEEYLSKEVIEYTEKGAIASALNTSESYGEAIVSHFDSKGNLISVTTTQYQSNHKKPSKLIKAAESTLKYRYYQDSSYSILAVLTVAIDDQIIGIDADKINTSSNTREVFHIVLNTKQVNRPLEDSIFIKKMLSQKYIRLSFEREDVTAVVYQKWFYDKNNKPLKWQFLNSNNDIDNIITFEYQYLTADKGILLGEKSEYNKFVIIDGEAKQLWVTDFVNCSNEIYTYDKQGNWITHSFIQKVGDGEAEKVKIKRKIEYWE
jgi:hypothetical protein